MNEKIDFSNLNSYNSSQREAVLEFINSVDYNTLCYIVFTVIEEHFGTLAQYVMYNFYRNIKDSELLLDDEDDEGEEL